MAVVRDTSEIRVLPHEAGEPTSLPFKRHLFVLGVVMAAAEVLAIGYPLWNMFDLGDLRAGTLVRLGLPVAIGAAIAWTAIVTGWLVPIRSCVAGCVSDATSDPICSMATTASSRVAPIRCRTKPE